MRPDGMRLPTRKNGVRFMERRDLDTVARLFLAVFRDRKETPSADLLSYLEELCFGSPALTPENGSLVYENRSGTILAALIAVPMRFRVGGRQVTARLLCSFMCCGPAGMRAAACLNHHFHGLSYDLVFSDTAQVQSVGHWRAGGGDMMPVESLAWCRVFRPLQASLERLERPGKGRASRALARVLRAPAHVADGLVRRAYPRFRANGSDQLSARMVDAAAFAGVAPALLSRFDVYPDWSGEDFSWVCAMAARNTRLGPLRFCLVEDGEGRAVGVAAWCGSAGGEANVLNLLCEDGRERECVAEVLDLLEQAGHSHAVGMTQTFLFPALQMQPHVCFRHRGFFCFSSSDSDVRAAGAGGRFYAGGLASESWSRLLNDF